MSLELVRQGSVAQLIINREQKRNAFTQAMWQQLLDYCVELQQQLPKLLIIEAVGDKAFCAGADIEELTQIIQQPQRQIENNKVVQQAHIALQNLSCATLAVIKGACVGGGFGIALCCDFRVATTQAKFGITPAKLGLVYSIEDTRRVVNTLGAPRAKELLFTGKIIDAQQAYEWGALTELVTAEQLDETVQQIVEQLLSASRYSITGVKQTIGWLQQTGADQEHQVRALFDQAFTEPDFAEGSAAFLEKRKANFL